MTTKKRTAERREAAKASLLAILGEARTMYTKVERVSRSGMTRVISCYVVGADGEIRDVSGYVADVVGWPRGKQARSSWPLGVKVEGCGMDMGFHLVYSLSRYLFPSSEEGKDGGYTLKQRWL